MTAPSDPRRAFLGTGWKFPLQVTAQGALALSTAEQKVEESILLILSTAPGERVMEPDFGCGIHELVFAPGNSTTRSQVVDRVRRALATYEQRIDLLEVVTDVSPEQPNLLLIRVDYRVRDTNALGNLVYPFFITEGA